MAGADLFIAEPDHDGLQGGVIEAFLADGVEAFLEQGGLLLADPGGPADDGREAEDDAGQQGEPGFERAEHPEARWSLTYRAG